MDLKAYKKDFSGLGWRMTVSAVLVTAIQLASQYIALEVNAEWAESMDIMLAVTMVPLYVLGYPLAFLIVRAGSDRRRIEKRRMKLSHFFTAFSMCYALLIAGNFIGMAITFVIGFFKGESVNNALLDIVSNGNIWISAVYTVLLAPVYEEILFRKLICDRVVKYGQGMAVLLSGLMFGLFHGNFNQAFYAFFLGCFLAFIYVKTGNIKYTIGLHMLVNFIGTVVGGLIVQNVNPEQISIPIMIILALYVLFLFGIVTAGVVLLLIHRSKFQVEAGEIVIEKGSRFRTAILNVGMLVYCVWFLFVMIVQALL